MPAGSLVGALIVSKLADWIGRKKVIILSGWVWVVGSILQCAAQVVLYPQRQEYYRSDMRFIY